MAFFSLYEHICSQFYYSPETTCDLLLQAWFSKTWKQSLECRNLVFVQSSAFQNAERVLSINLLPTHSLSQV